MSTCFFIGHRDTPETVFLALCAAVEQHIVEFDITEFLVGNHGNFDRLAAAAVTMAKAKHPHVKLVGLLSYHPTNRPSLLPDGFDGTVYPSALDTVPQRVATVRANRWGVQQSSHLIAYVRHSASNAAAVMAYAVRRGVAVQNLGV